MAGQRKKKKRAQSTRYLDRFKKDPHAELVEVFTILDKAIVELISFLDDYELIYNHKWFFLIFTRLDSLKRDNKDEYSALIKYLTGKKDKFAGCKPTPTMIVRYLTTTPPGNSIAKLIERDIKEAKRK